MRQLDDVSCYKQTVITNAYIQNGTFIEFVLPVIFPLYSFYSEINIFCIKYFVLLYSIFYTVTWFNFNSSMDVWDEITYPFLNFNGCTVEV